MLVSLQIPFNPHRTGQYNPQCTPKQLGGWYFLVVFLSPPLPSWSQKELYARQRRPAPKADGDDGCITGGFLEGGERKVLRDILWKYLGYLLGFIAMILPENGVGGILVIYRCRFIDFIAMI